MSGTKIVHNLVVVVGKYMKDGKEKNNYENVGVMLEKDDGGRFILLNRTFNPAGVPNPDNREKVLISMFDAEKKEGSNDI